MCGVFGLMKLSSSSNTKENGQHKDDREWVCSWWCGKRCVGEWWKQNNKKMFNKFSPIKKVLNKRSIKGAVFTLRFDFLLDLSIYIKIQIEIHQDHFKSEILDFQLYPSTGLIHFHLLNIFPVLFAYVDVWCGDFLHCYYELWTKEAWVKTRSLWICCCCWVFQCSCD